MSERKTSKEERYLKKLFELASSKGDPQMPINRFRVGQSAGFNDKSVKNMVQLMTQNNFIKKGEDDLVSLTPQGLDFLKGLY